MCSGTKSGSLIKVEAALIDCLVKLHWIQIAKIRVEMGLSHDQMSPTASVVVGAQRIRARLPSDVTHICVAAPPQRRCG